MFARRVTMFKRFIRFRLPPTPRLLVDVSISSTQISSGMQILEMQNTIYHIYFEKNAHEENKDNHITRTQWKSHKRKTIEKENTKENKRKQKNRTGTRKKRKRKWKMEHKSQSGIYRTKETGDYPLTIPSDRLMCLAYNSSSTIMRIILINYYCVSRVTTKKCQLQQLLENKLI